MKNNIVVVTDSACDIPDELLKAYDIRILPLRVFWKGKDYRDRAELDGSIEAHQFAQDMGRLLGDQDVLLLYAAKSSTCNHAVILRDWLTERMEEKKR